MSANAGRPRELPSCGDMRPDSRESCVRHPGHAGPHRSLTGIKWRDEDALCLARRADTYTGVTYRCVERRDHSDALQVDAHTWQAVPTSSS